MRAVSSGHRLHAAAKLDPAGQPAAGKAVQHRGGGLRACCATPQGLAGCLSALGAPSTTPLLVDVATFEGKPAAVLVLPGDGRRPEIWVVSPTCTPGADGMKYFTTVTLTGRPREQPGRTMA